MLISLDPVHFFIVLNSVVFRICMVRCSFFLIGRKHHKKRKHFFPFGSQEDTANNHIFYRNFQHYYVKNSVSSIKYVQQPCMLLQKTRLFAFWDELLHLNTTIRWWVYFRSLSQARLKHAHWIKACCVDNWGRFSEWKHTIGGLLLPKNTLVAAALPCWRTVCGNPVFDGAACEQIKWLNLC